MREVSRLGAFLFVLNTLLLGVGLSMDAFSVSLANGLGEPEMKTPRMCVIAGVYGLFQAAMPLTGWVCVHFAAERFSAFQRAVPYIALALLLFVGGKMLIEGMHDRKKEEEAVAVLGVGALLMQGLATSIDALSVGFTIAGYPFVTALIAALMIGTVTFIICLCGLWLGKRFGTRLAGRATILGGIILIGIGIEIFIKGLIG